jgi:hypothetical protein
VNTGTDSSPDAGHCHVRIRSDTKGDFTVVAVEFGSGPNLEEAIAFSSEVDAGSREENASKQKA